AAALILHHHDALEAILVVRREGRHQLLDRRVDRLEDGHSGEQLFRASQDAATDHVGRHGAHREDEQHHHQDADARRGTSHQPRGQWCREVVNDTEYPHQRRNADDQRNRDEKAREEAASQPLTDAIARHAYLQPAASAARIASPSTMRYQANGANPARRMNARNGRMTSSEAMNAITKPMAISAARAGASELPTSSRSWPKAAAIVGMARKNENSAAAGRSSPISMPPTIVAPLRDTPGTSASTWQRPTPSAREMGVCSASRIVGAGRKRSTISITMPPAMNAPAMTAGWS